MHLKVYTSLNSRFHKLRKRRFIFAPTLIGKRRKAGNAPEGIHFIKFPVPKTSEAKIYLRPNADWQNDVKRDYPARGYTLLKPPI